MKNIIIITLLMNCLGAITISWSQNLSEGLIASTEIFAKNTINDKFEVSKDLNVEVINMSGQTVFTEETSSNDDSLEKNISSEAKEKYILTIKDRDTIARNVLIRE